MNNDRNALKAGTFIVVTVGLIVAIIFAIKGTGTLGAKYQVRSVRFKLADDVGGLRAGDDVRVGGFKVGTVKAIDAAGLDSGDAGAGGGEPHIVISFTVPEKFVMREGSRVGIQTTLTGTSVLNVESLGVGAPLPPEAALAGVADPKTRLFASLGGAGEGIETLIPKVGQTVDSFKKTADTATDLIAHAKTKIDPAVEKYNNVAVPAGETMAHARDLLGDSKGDLRGTFANLNAVSGTVKQNLPETMTRLNGVLGKVEGSVDKVQKTLGDVEATMANAKDISATARGVVTGNKARLNGIVAGLKTTSDNLKAASGDIRRSPWRLLYKPGRGEMANLNLYDSARQFAEGANDLNDAASALRDALAAKDVEPAQLQALVNKLDETFAGFQAVETKLWDSVRE